MPNWKTLVVASSPDQHRLEPGRRAAAVNTRGSAHDASSLGPADGDRYTRERLENIYFALTDAFNREAPTVALASGQAVVYYRIAIMSKDGDWVIRETPEACERVLQELERRGARYRLGAPLDVRWLAGGWSSHFEFFDERQRRVRCDFVSRPPRVPLASLASLFEGARRRTLLAVDAESLILMKQTQRAKDYAVIADVAALLPPEREVEWTTDPDRILALAGPAGALSQRPAVRAAMTGGGRRAVVTALAQEADELQRRDAARLKAYEAAADAYLTACRAAGAVDRPLREAHARLCEMAERWLPKDVAGSQSRADAQ